MRFLLLCAKIIIDSEKALWYTDVSTKIERCFSVQNRSGRRGSIKNSFGGEKYGAYDSEGP